MTELHLALAFFFGSLFTFAFSSAFVISRFTIMRSKPCVTCGRPGAVFAQAIDIETRKVLAFSIVCHPCANYSLSSVRLPPWAKLKEPDWKGPA